MKEIQQESYKLEKWIVGGWFVLGTRRRAESQWNGL